MLQSAQGFRYKSELNHEGFGVMEKIMGGKQIQNLAAKTEERISTKKVRKKNQGVSSFIHNSQNMETTLSVHQWMNG